MKQIIDSNGNIYLYDHDGEVLKIGDLELGDLLDPPQDAGKYVENPADEVIETPTEEITCLQAELDKVYAENEFLAAKIQDLETSKEQLTKVSEEYINEIDDNSQEIEGLISQIEHLQSQISEKDREIAQHVQENCDRMEEVYDLQKKNDQLVEDIAWKDNNIGRLENDVDYYKDMAAKYLAELQPPKTPQGKGFSLELFQAAAKQLKNSKNAPIDLSKSGMGFKDLYNYCQKRDQSWPQKVINKIKSWRFV